MKQSNSQKGRIPKLRERLFELQGDMSITDFARKLKLSRQTLGFYLNGDRIPDSETLLQICESCKVSADWLLGLSDDPTIESYTIDQLGLSPQAIDNLKKYSSSNNAADFINGINTILTIPRISVIAKRISQLESSIQIENRYLERFMEDTKGSFNDKWAAVSAFDEENEDLCSRLEDTISEALPNLKGRIEMYIGRAALAHELEYIANIIKGDLDITLGYYECVHGPIDE